jgi:hypothetical protein
MTVPLARPARGLVRFLYTSNPFYILSADLVFVGLRVSFGAGGPVARPWALAISLASYTLLLATTACILIRLGRLWDDLRSILLVVVMMFVAMAMSCDDTMAAGPSKGALGCVAGFVFAVVVTEAVLHTIRLKVPGWYRVAYYLIVGLVFLYPVGLWPLLGNPENRSLQWALFSFGPLAGLAVATLVPAARRGAAYVAKNGSPWSWPLYPWALFVVLIGGLCIRCSALCVSFHYVEGSRSIFGPYFLVPIGLAVSLVALEIGIISGRRAVMVAASAAPLALAILAATGHRHELVYQNFLRMFIQTVGASPFYLVSVAAILFLVYAVARRVPFAVDLMALGLVALAFVGPRTSNFHELVPAQPQPIGAAALVLATKAWRRRDSWRASMAAACLVISLTRAWELMWPASDSWPVTLHVSVAALLAVGALFDDPLGRLARRVGAVALFCLGLNSATGQKLTSPAKPWEPITWYPYVVALTAWSFGFLKCDRWYVTSGAASLAVTLAHSGTQAYSQLRKLVVGLDQITWGMLFFVVAAAISMRKAGIWPRSGPNWLLRLFYARQGGSSRD